MRAALHRKLAGPLVLLLLAACGGEAPPAPEAPEEEAPSEADQHVQATQTAEIGSESAQATQPTPDAAAAVEPAAPVVWVPTLKFAKAPRVADVLRMAQQAEKEQRWFDGENSALALYWQALQLDSENLKALDGQARVLAAIRDALDVALQSRQWAEAEQHVAALVALEADDAARRAWWQRIEQRRQIAALLDEAAAFRASGDWITPADANAVDRYRAVLAMEENDPEALQGLSEVEGHLLDQALRAATEGKFRRADRLFSDAASVLPGSQSVQDASAQLMTERTRRTEQMLIEAQAALGQLDFVRVESLLEEIDAASAQVAGVDELRARLDNARIYGLLNPGQRFLDALQSAGTGPEMRVLPVGRFRMGSPDDEAQRKKNEGPRHEVALNHPIAMSINEISVADFAVFVNQTQHVTDAEREGRSTIYDERNGRMVERRRVNWRDDHAGERAAPELPVVHVSWRDAQAYVMWLRAQTGKAYRLPSESEFEYALRAGGDTRFPWGSGGPARNQGNFTGGNDRSATNREWKNAFEGYGDGYWGTAPVGSFKANAFGLHDMAGNVSEWVEDCWHDSYKRAPTDGSAWVNPGCNERVVRGASWASAPDQVRSAFRLGSEPETTNPRLGFRVARALDRPVPMKGAPGQ